MSQHHKINDPLTEHLTRMKNEEESKENGSDPKKIMLSGVNDGLDIDEIAQQLVRKCSMKLSEAKRMAGQFVDKLEVEFG